MKKEKIKDLIISIGISGIFLWIALVGLVLNKYLGGDFGK